MAILQEFKTFAMRGNVVDMTVGIVVGGAFGKIASSLVNDILMPPIGLLLGRVDFSNLYVSLSGKSYNSLAAAKAAGAATLSYGLFLNTILDFVIVAFAMFMLVRQINRIQSQPQQTPTTKPCPFCVSNIAISARRCPFCTSELDRAA